jgi:hypothetical protein
LLASYAAPLDGITVIKAHREISRSTAMARLPPCAGGSRNTVSRCAMSTARPGRPGRHADRRIAADSTLPPREFWSGTGRV